MLATLRRTHAVMGTAISVARVRRLVREAVSLYESCGDPTKDVVPVRIEKPSHVAPVPDARVHAY